MRTQNLADQRKTSHIMQSDDIIQVLDEEGTVLPSAEVPDLSEQELVSMYEAIKLARRFDDRAVTIQRQGRIATYAPMTGQEGSQVASSYALDSQDWLFPTYREHAAKYVHGMKLASLVKTLRGHREGYEIPDDVNVMPEYIPVATQVPQAMGMAWGFKLQSQADRAVMCHLGDGATSKGDFHEGLNFAGVFDVPVVLMCNNNQWAISVPRERQTASETLAQKAQSYGIERVRVDGQDPLAVYKVTRDALNKAKLPAEGQRRPTFIESVQYRYGPHTTADDPTDYREKDEPEEWRKKDPLDRLRRYLCARGILNEQLESEIDARIDAQISDAIDEAEATETDPDQIFDHVYDEMPDRLEEQRDELDALREKYGDESLSEVGE